MNRTARSTTSLFFSIAGALSFATACGSGTVGVSGFEDAALDTYEIAVLPDDLSTFSELLDRSDERFVMVNMLVFKDMATGEGFDDLTGREAYQIYIDGLREAQMAIGSRLIWGGSVDAQVVGESDPVFQSIGLLEYASPTAFVGFAAEPGDNPEARSAGLRGQWLVASTTLNEGDPNAPTSAVPSMELPDVDSLVETTGLSEEQIGRVLDGPPDEPVFIVELLRFKNGNRSKYSEYEAGIAPVLEDQGARFIWRGSYDIFAIGAADPAFDEMVVTEFPNRNAYLLALSDPRTAAVAQSRAGGLATHWIYTAREALLTGF